MKLSYVEVLRRTANFKEEYPRIFSRLVEQFRDMSEGGTGGLYLLSQSRISVRDQYYKNWNDNDFKSLLIDLGEDVP